MSSSLLDLSARFAVVATVVFNVGYLRTGLYSITLLHRYFAHRAFQTTWWVRAVLLAGFFSTLEGWGDLWVRWHRQHHADVDTEFDRHSPAVWGFAHSQELWHIKRAFITLPPARFTKDFRSVDLKHLFDPLQVMDNNYKWWAIGMGIILPILVCGLGWGDWWGGVLVCFTRIMVVQHLTSTINSFAHMWGETVEEGATATNTRSRFFAWLVVGEPWHGNHHKVPNSYRFGWDEGQWDPGARLIEWLARRGWAWNLRTNSGLIHVRESI